MTIGLPLIMGCSHKAAKSEADESAPNATSATQLSSDLGNAYGLETVHFSFDSQLLDKTAKSQLQLDAQILQKNPNVQVQVEGHCDSRGGIQYNVALGEKRAQTVKHFLEDLGIRSSRIATISYGKERPLDPAETEEAFAKNRRANFVIVQGTL